MAAIEFVGLLSLRKRLTAFGAMPGLTPALREEAEAVAEAARSRLASRGSGELARSIEITDLSEKNSSAFAIRTRDPVGRYLEFGTMRMRAFPWLGPALFGRSRAVNHKLRKVIGEAMEAMRKA